MKDLISTATANGTTVIIVAVPLVDKYTMPAPFLNFLSHTPNTFFFDANNMKNIGEEDFRKDRFHLNPDGARKLTAFILREFKERVLRARDSTIPDSVLR